jgi:hypothetical protein
MIAGEEKSDGRDTSSGAGVKRFGAADRDLQLLRYEYAGDV